MAGATRVGPRTGTAGMIIRKTVDGADGPYVKAGVVGKGSGHDTPGCSTLEHTGYITERITPGRAAHNNQQNCCIRQGTMDGH